MAIIPSDISSLTTITPSPIQNNNAISEATKGFSDVFKHTLNEVNKSQAVGEEAIKQLNSGEAQNLHDVMIAVEQADLSLRMLVQMRNKALEAYNEILRMNI